MTTTAPNNVAGFIRQQIGTDVWLAVSARQALATSTGLTFRFGNRYGLARHIQITLKPSDTYRIVATKVRRNGRVDVIADYDDITWESLGWIVRNINQEEEFAS